TAPVSLSPVWQAMNSTQITDVGDPPPSPANLGDTWFSRTGSASGILHVYTGIGRYPVADWDATGYWSTANTTTLAFKPNFSDFSTSNYGEMYICGYTSGVPADVQPTILVNAVTTLMPNAALFTVNK